MRTFQCPQKWPSPEYFLGSRCPLSVSPLMIRAHQLLPNDFLSVGGWSSLEPGDQVTSQSSWSSCFILTAVIVSTLYWLLGKFRKVGGNSRISMFTCFAVVLKLTAANLFARIARMAMQCNNGSLFESRNDGWDQRINVWMPRGGKCKWVIQGPSFSPLCVPLSLHSSGL
mgnify:CR=1 FL=1